MKGRLKMANIPNAFNTFKQEAEKRQEQQQQIEAKLIGEDQEPSGRVRMNITLPVENKNRLQAAARKKSVSASYLIQSWIEEHCD